MILAQVLNINFCIFVELDDVASRLCGQIGKWRVPLVICATKEFQFVFLLLLLPQYEATRCVQLCLLPLYYVNTRQWCRHRCLERWLPEADCPISANLGNWGQNWAIHIWFDRCKNTWGVRTLKNMKQREGDSHNGVSPPSVASGRADQLRQRHTGPKGDSRDGDCPLSFKLRSNWRRRQSRWEKD